MDNLETCGFGFFNCLGQTRLLDEDQVQLNDKMAREPVIVNVYDMVIFDYSFTMHCILFRLDVH